jgi:hypothetical protein
MTLPRIAILGAGPIGLEAALAATQAGADVTLFERGMPAANVRACGHVRMFSPWRMNVSARGLKALAAGEGAFAPPPLDACPTGQEFVERYLRPLADLPVLKSVLKPHHEVLQIGREGLGKLELAGDPARANHPFRLLIRDGEGRLSIYLAEAVIDATGVAGLPMPAGSGGMPAPGEAAAADRLAYGLPDVEGAQREDYLGRRTLVVGGGHSALSVVLALGELWAESPATRVIWARRTRRTYPARGSDPLGGRRELEAAGNELLAARPEWLTLHDEAEVDEIERRRSGLEVTLCTPGDPIILEVDRMVAANGFRPDRELYRELTVQECFASAAPMPLAATLLAAGTGDSPGGPEPEIGHLRTTEPNFFIVGAKSYGRTPAFLLPAGRRQVALVLADLGLDVGRDGEVEVEHEVERSAAAERHAALPGSR